jgi:hypothetical protein
VGAQSAANAGAGTTISATASCPAGKKLLGGGGRSGATAAAQERRVVLKESYPSGAGSWTVVALVINNLTGGTRATVAAAAVCTA